MALTATGLVAIKMPDHLLLQMKAGLGMSLGAVLIEGKQFTIYAPMQNHVYSGTADAIKDQRLFPIDINSVDLFHSAAGLPIIEPMPNDSLTIDDGKYLIITYQPKGSTRYWVDPKKFVITDVHVLNNSGELVIRQEYRQFSKEKGIYLPKLIRVQHMKGNERVTFYYTGRAVNQKIDDDTFSLRIPENTRHIKLPIDGNVGR